MLGREADFRTSQLQALETESREEIQVTLIWQSFGFAAPASFGTLSG